jgi:glycosyltransferase involved in cell wall biosynthesis
MRIGMMADVYKPHVSGITNYISLNKKILEKAGHEVFVFTFGDDDYPDNEDNIVRSPGLPLTDTGYYLSFRYKRPARKLLYTMDIVHVHHPFLSGSLALRYCRPLGIPIVFTNHTRYDLYAQAYIPLIADLVGETMLQAFIQPFCRACDMVIAPSAGMKDVLRRFGVDSPIEVIPNGVELAPFKQGAHPLDRSSLGFDEDDVVLVYTGRLGPEKNLSFLLRSFAGAVQAYDHMRLLLVGDGPERETLQEIARNKQIEGKVHFTGMIPYEDMASYLCTADIFVTASVTEVHPLSVIEAMAAGLPVLGVQSPGVGDTVEDGVTGFLSSEDMAAFTAKMIRLVTDEGIRREMSLQARKASEAYAIERTNQLVLEKYEKLVKESAGRRKGWRSRISRYMDSLRS